MSRSSVALTTFLPAILVFNTASAAVSEDPLIKPMAVDRAPEWLAPRTPKRLYGNSYLVGFAGLSVVLIDSGDGLILIDGALPQAAPQILANVRALGFDPRKIRYILSTEPHFDHAGGLAALARDTGATVVASEAAAKGLRIGAHLPDDPQLGYGGTWPGLKAVRTVKPGDVLRLANVAITAEATPGHTAGSMSWRWQSCDRPGPKRRCKTMVFAASLNPVTYPDYRYTAPASQPIVEGFRRSYARMKQMPCDVLIAAHPDNAFAPGEGKGRQFNEAAGACRAYAERSEAKLNARLKAGE